MRSSLISSYLFLHMNFHENRKAQNPLYSPWSSSASVPNEDAVSLSLFRTIHRSILIWFSVPTCEAKVWERERMLGQEFERQADNQVADHRREYQWCVATRHQLLVLIPELRGHVVIVSWEKRTVSDDLFSDYVHCSLRLSSVKRERERERLR